MIGKTKIFILGQSELQLFFHLLNVIIMKERICQIYLSMSLKKHLKVSMQNDFVSLNNEGSSHDDDVMALETSNRLKNKFVLTG